MKIQLKVGRVASRGAHAVAIFFDGTSIKTRRGRVSKAEPIRMLDPVFDPPLGETVWVKPGAAELERVSADRGLAFKDTGIERLVIIGESSSPPAQLKMHGALNGKPLAPTLIAGPFAPEDDWVLEFLKRLPSPTATRPPNPSVAPTTLRRFIGAVPGRLAKLAVLDVLRLLVEDRDNVLFIDAYQAAGARVRDPEVIESRDRLLRVMNYRSHASRLNFSVLCLKDVKVRRKAGGVPLDRKQWDTYNVIRDGELQIPLLHASLSRHSWNVLNDAGVVAWEDAYDPTKIYELRLEGCPLVRRSWADAKTQRFVELLRERADLTTEAKALRRRRNQLARENPALLLSFPRSGKRISIHRGRGRKETPTRTYEAAHVEIRLLGHKPPRFDYGDFLFAQADGRLTHVERRLTVVRFLIRCIVLALETFQVKIIAWDAGKRVKRRGTEKLEQLAGFDGAALKRVTWTSAEKA